MTTLPTRYLVCESGACNPAIHDYDQLAERVFHFTMQGDKMAQAMFVERARALVHTPHEWYKNSYDTHHGLISSWRCAICGNIKRY